MCGRFALTMPTEAMEDLFEASAVETLPAAEERYNICPTQTIPVVVAHDGARHIAPMRWGFLPKWYKTPNGGPLLINARSETIREKPAFRAAFPRRRCLIPASGFYEWTHRLGRGQAPWYITMAGNAPMAMAAIWQGWTPPEGGERAITCAIVTCDAGEDIAEVHHRQPVFVAPDAVETWLEGDAGAAGELMVPSPAGVLRRHRVSTEVNSMKNQGPGLIAPIAE